MYKIVRHFFDAPNVTVRRGLSLDEAQTHCKSDDTHGEGWFDGYTEDDAYIDVEYEHRHEPYCALRGTDEDYDHKYCTC